MTIIEEFGTLTEPRADIYPDTPEELLSRVQEDEIEDPAREPLQHQQLQVMCARLHDVMVGRAATKLLESGIAPGAYRLIVLPAWDWRLPAMEIGRKGIDRNTGDQLLMPVRLDWDGDGSLLRLEAASQQPEAYHWTARSMGYTDDGIVTVRPGRGIVSASIVQHTGTHRGMEDFLRKLIHAGRDAMWQFLNALEPFVTKTVRKAHAAVCYEIADLTGRVQDVLHETGIQQVVDGMMFGATAEDGRPESASILRMIDLCLRPECFTKVDPLRYVHAHIRRDAEDQVRRAIRDPRIGPKIRRVASQMRGATVEEIVEEYRKIYPQDRLSISRAEAALSVSADPMALSVPLDPETNRGAK